MTEPQRRKAEEIFAEAIDVPRPERDAFVAEKCAGDPKLEREVYELLESHDDASKEGFLSGPTLGGVESLESQPSALDEGPGSSVGSYKLLEQIGEGGFGVVYMAEQSEPINRRVAIKLIKVGMDTKQVIARFEAERQALALMDHPGIARVFDAGSTPSGRPYFAMELVRGVPITEYCDSARLGTRERLSLFAGVCRAVHHAHQKGVIHRDIKPSNVLVTLHDGVPVPKVIDFGIAKATSARLTERTLFTEFRQFVGTPEYMSPEQAEMSGLDVDTRTDVYSLGVLLYELLTGTTPLDPRQLREAGLAEILRIVREVEPPRPSTRLSTLGDAATTAAASRGIDAGRLVRSLRGELDWIIMMALEKDRARRYDSASALAEDLERAMRDEPVRAGPPSAAYRLNKFVRRNRAAVFVTSALLAMLVAGTAGTTIGLVRSNRAEAVAMAEALRASDASALAAERASEAERQAAIAEAVNEFLNRDLLSHASPELTPDPNVTVRTVLDRARDSIGGRFADQPLVEAGVRNTLGSTYSALGLYETAREQYERALELRRRELGEEHEDTVATSGTLAGVLLELGEYERAREMYAEAIRRSTVLHGPLDVTTLRLRQGLAQLEERSGDRADSVTILREVVDAYESTGLSASNDGLGARNSLAFSLDRMSQFDEAIEIFEAVLPEREALLGPDHPDTLVTMGNLALTLNNVGRFEEAATLFDRTIARSRRVLGPDHDYTIMLEGNLALSYQFLGRNDDAEIRFVRSLEAYEDIFGSDHPTTLHAAHNLGSFYASIGRFEDAEPLLVRALERRRELLGEDSFDTQASMGILGRLYFQQQRFDEAEPLITDALRLARESLGPDHEAALAFMNMLASMYAAQQRYDEAIPLYRETIAALKRVMPEGFVGTGVTCFGLARALSASERWEEAEPVWLEAHEILSATFGPEHPRTIATIDGLIRSLESQGKEAEAGEWRSRLPVPASEG